MNDFENKRARNVHILSNVVLGLGIAIGILYFVISILTATNENYKEILLSGILTMVYSILLGIFFKIILSGFSEIINLLDKIYKQKENATDRKE